MVRQARAEATRHKIIDAAVDLFSEAGYSAVGLSEIIARTETTKGAFYFHFDSKESLAAAIVEESSAVLLSAFGGLFDSSAPALENMIHGAFVVADVMAGNKLARTGGQLIRVLGEYNGTAGRSYEGWLAAMTAQADRAIAEGDIRECLDPDDVGEAVIAGMLGADLLSTALSGGGDFTQRFSRVWQILLPAIATDESLPYFREFLARESMRYLQPTLSVE